MNTKLSIWSSYYYGLSPEETVERFIKNGINCCELSDEHGFELLSRSDDIVETGKAFARFINERGFEIPQGHLWLEAQICSCSDAVDTLCKWIDLYEAIGIKNMVLHCDNLFGTKLSKEEKTEENIKKLRLISKHIDDKDVTICLENLFAYVPNEKESIDQRAEDLLSIIESIGSKHFGICLDTGHLNLSGGNQREFILKAGDKLKALHIADNQGQTDQHMMPYTRGSVNFEEVVEALREIGYKGIFNLEIPGESHIPMELRDAKIKYIKVCYDYLMNL